MKTEWKKHLIRLIVLQAVPALALLGSVYFLKAPQGLSIGIYLVVAFGSLVIYCAAVFAQRRGMLPLGIPIKPLRPSGSEQGDGVFYLGSKRSDSGGADGHDRVIEDYIETARSLIQTSRVEEAAALLGKALELDPVNSRLLNYLGICLSRMSRYEEAVRAYRSSIEQDFDNASAHFNLAVALENSERIADATEQYKRYLKVGRIVGEPEEMLARAGERLRCLQGG